MDMKFVEPKQNTVQQCYLQGACNADLSNSDLTLIN